MRIGFQLDPRDLAGVDAILAAFTRAEDEGFHTIWLGQVFAHDALTLLALAGTCTQRIELGTSVVPLPPRHPTVLAQQALTTQLATGNRLCLGVGSGHAAILDRKLGLEPDHPVERTAETLDVLLPLLRGEYVKFEGRFQRMRVGTPIAGAEAPSVILGALAPRMIELAGARTDGVSVVFVGARFIAEQVRPLLPPGARIVASVPVALTERPAEVAAAIDAGIAQSTAMPAYQRVLQEQQTERASALGAIGSVAEVADQLDALAAAGVTDLNPILLRVGSDPGCARRTRDWLAERARSFGRAAS